MLSSSTIVSDNISEITATSFVKNRVFSLSHRGSGRRAGKTEFLIETKNYINVFASYCAHKLKTVTLK
jgi:hypothetical protein